MVERLGLSQRRGFRLPLSGRSMRAVESMHGSPCRRQRQRWRVGAKLEDDEADNEPDHEHRDVRDRGVCSSYVVADSWEPKNHGHKYDEYDDSCDEAYEGRHDGRKRAPSPFVGC